MKTYKQRILIFLSLTIFAGVISNAQDCYWAKQAGGTWWDGATRIAIDSQGNSYVAGDTQSNYCFFQTDSLWAGENNSLFIVKYNSNGQELWVKKIGGGNIIPGYRISFGGLKYDSITGCLLANGTFYNQAYFGDTVLTGSQLTVFTIKMTLNGEILWARASGGAGEDHAFDITSDEQGNVYISGSNQNSATFNNISIPAGGFLAKYDASGNLIWAEKKFRYIPIVYTEAPPIVLNFNNQRLLVNGNAFNDTIIIDSVIVLNSFSTYSTYISSFNADGVLQWIKLAGQTDDGGCGYQMPTDKFGNLYITGVFQHKGIFGNDTIRNDVAFYDGFLAKYSGGGELIWVKQLNSTNEAWGVGLATDSGGDVYLSGFFKGSATFGNTTLISQSGRDMFISHYSKDGECLGVRQYSKGIPYSLFVDSQENIYFTGEFEDTLLIGSKICTSRGKSDIFAAKCSQITGVEELKTTPQKQLLIYANPNIGKCNITIPEEFANEKNLVLQIFDLHGKLIQQSKIEIVEGKIRLDIQAQAKGMYTAVLSNGKRSYTGKIVFE